MLSSQSGMSEPPKPGCSGTITSKRCDSVSQNGSQADGAARAVQEQQRLAAAAAHQAGLAAGDGDEAFLAGHGYGSPERTNR